MRIRDLDFVRGLAMLMVIFFHYPLVPYLEIIGYTGVDIFFVLSGFLISGLLFSEQDKHGEIKPVRFMIRRGFKIYPLFYFFILVTLLTLWFYDDKFLLRHLIGEITFTRNYVGGLWVHTWSLCVEEHFYLVIAVAMYYLKPQHWRQFRTVNTVFIILFLTSMLMELLNAWLETKLGTNYFLNVWARRVQTQYGFDSILYGVFISYQYRYNREKVLAFFGRYRYWLLAGSVAAALLLPLHRSPFYNPVKDTLLFISYGNIILLLASGIISMKNFHTTPVLKWIFDTVCFFGVYSYSIYLFHVWIRDKIMAKNETLYNHPYTFAIYFFLSVIIAYVFARAIEVPVLKLRERYFPSRS